MGLALHEDAGGSLWSYAGDDGRLSDIDFECHEVYFHWDLKFTEKHTKNQIILSLGKVIGFTLRSKKFGVCFFDLCSS